jgi:hypothetical protein
MNSTSRGIVSLKRKVFRRLNWLSIFVERKKSKPAAVTGFTRSGTTFIADLIAACLGWRMVHEPLNSVIPCSPVSIRNRDSRAHVAGSLKCREEIRNIFNGKFKGCRATNHGWRFLYTGRLVKLVRANFYLDVILEEIPELRLVHVLRHPCACVASRLALKWDVPDLSICIEDISDDLTDAQLRFYSGETPEHARMAATWCLDNKMALAAVSGSARAMTVSFEQLVSDPVSMTKLILNHIVPGHSIGVERIERENLLLRPTPGFDPLRVTQGWRDSLSVREKSDIAAVVDEFGLSDLYGEGYL